MSEEKHFSAPTKKAKIDIEQDLDTYSKKVMWNKGPCSVHDLSMIKSATYLLGFLDNCFPDNHIKEQLIKFKHDIRYTSKFLLMSVLRLQCQFPLEICRSILQYVKANEDDNKTFFILFQL